MKQFINERQIKKSPLFSELMRVKAVRIDTFSALSVGLVGTQIEWFHRIILNSEEVADLTILNEVYAHYGDGENA